MLVNVTFVAGTQECQPLYVTPLSAPTLTSVRLTATVYGERALMAYLVE